MKHKSASFFARAQAGILAHKILIAVIAVTVIVGGYEIYKAKASEASNVPQYTLTAAHIGTLMQTVSGTGQVSASNQTDILSQVSGTIESINVSVGQAVKKGQLIATIDPTNALTTLQNAKIALAKLTEPAKTTDLSSAKDSVNKSYDDAFNSASSVYLDLPTIMAGMKDLLYGQGTFLSSTQEAFLNSTARADTDAAGMAYDKAAAQYAMTFQEFKGLSRSSPKTDLDTLYRDTYTTIKLVADATSKAQSAVAYITSNQPSYMSKDASTVASNLNTWSNQANSDASSMLGAQSAITSAQNSLTNLTAAPDTYDLQSAQDTLAQAERTYAEYFIRAPYDGIIGRIPVSVFGQAGGSTAIATIVGQQKIASISLNEVDAAKVVVGQKVNITFDAIDSLNATGTVSEVDQIGTVTSGVVSYGVKIIINTDDARIKPGMSVNTSIITKEDDNVLLVPSAAVKTQTGRSYVQTFDRSVLTSMLPNGGNQTASGTSRFAGSTGSFASSTGSSGTGSSTPLGTGSTTRSFSGTAGARAGAASLTISSSVPPQNTVVTTGDSDDTNTVILSGLTPGQLVVTRTATGASATSAAAPSLLQSIGGGNRTGGTGAARPAGGGGAAVGGVRIGG